MTALGLAASVRSPVEIMESVVSALVQSGPVGIVAALEAMAIAGLWFALRTADRALLEEVRRSAEALHKSTEAIRESNSSRAQLADAIREFGSVSNTILGRVERLSALLEAGSFQSPRRGRGD